MREAQKEKVAIDSDFIFKLAEIKDDDRVNLCKKLFDELLFAPLVHELLRKHELEPMSANVRQFIDKDVISICEFLHELSPAEKLYYESVVRSVYKQLMGVDYPVDDIFDEWERSKSLG